MAEVPDGSGLALEAGGANASAAASSFGGLPSGVPALPSMGVGGNPPSLPAETGAGKKFPPASETEEVNVATVMEELRNMSFNMTHKLDALQGQLAMQAAEFLGRTRRAHVERVERTATTSSAMRTPVPSTGAPLPALQPVGIGTNAPSFGLFSRLAIALRCAEVRRLGRTFCASSAVQL